MIRSSLSFAALAGLVMVLVVFATACTTTTGRAANTANADQLEVGVTTIEQAERLLGRPTNVTRTPDGTVLGYVRTEVRNRSLFGHRADVDSEVFTLIFDNDGRLVRYGDSRQNTSINR